MDVNEELQLCENSKKKIGGGGGRVGGVQGGCDRRIEVFGKVHNKKKIFFFGGGGGRREVSGGGGGRGVRVDVNEELGVGGGWGGRGLVGGEGGVGGVGSVGGVWLGGQDGCERRIEVFVKIHKKKFGRGGGWGGQGVRWGYCTKRYCTILRK